jgi:hemerythrin
MINSIITTQYQIPQEEINNLKIASATSYNNKDNKAPNILRALLSLTNSHFDKQEVYLLHCHYTCGWECEKINKLINLDTNLYKVRQKIQSLKDDSSSLES